MRAITTPRLKHKMRLFDVTDAVVATTPLMPLCQADRPDATLVFDLCLIIASPLLDMHPIALVTYDVVRAVKALKTSFSDCGEVKKGKTGYCHEQPHCSP